MRAWMVEVCKTLAAALIGVCLALGVDAYARLLP
jgi:hypothetical protein